MSEEALELESVSTENETSQSENDLENFNWVDYESFLPTDETARTALIKMFSEKPFGWKVRAKLLMKLARSAEYTTRLQAELVEAATGESKNRGPRGPRVISPRTGLRVYLASLTDDKLREVSEDQEVSYNSFMNSNDRVGLIECIIDEMLPSE